MIVRIADKKTFSLPFYGDEKAALTALAVASVAHGESRIGGIPENAETENFLRILSQLGLTFSFQNSKIVLHGKGKFFPRKPDGPLNAGSNGLLLRILLGLLPGQNFESEIVAEGILARRSLVRVMEPLHEMGAQIHFSYRQTLPAKVFPSYPLKGISYAAPLPTFFTKICLELAALYTEEETLISEPYPSLSFCEDLLSNAEKNISSASYSIRVHPGETKPLDLQIPMDAQLADLMALTAIIQQREIVLENISPAEGQGTVIEWLRDNADNISFERRGDLASVRIPAVPGFEKAEFRGPQTKKYLNSLPCFAVLCAALGRPFSVRGALDLRQKNCDWIVAVADGLAGFGIETEEFEDGFAISGREKISGGAAVCYHDEIISLAFLALGLGVGDYTELRELAATPRLLHLLKYAGAEIVSPVPQDAELTAFNENSDNRRFFSA